MKVGFWNGLAKNIDKNDVVDPALVELVKKYLTPTADVLEIGPGTGSLTLRLAPFCQSIEACDLSPEMIAKAKQKERPETVNFEIQDASQLTYEANSFDVVLGMNVLHVVTDIDQVLVELYRVLKPSGLLIVQVATFKEQQFVSIITRMAMQMLKFRLWPVQTYEEALVRHGFDLESNQELRAGSMSVMIIAKKR